MRGILWEVVTAVGDDFSQSFIEDFSSHQRLTSSVIVESDYEFAPRVD